MGCGDDPVPDPQARKAAEWALRRGGTVRIVDLPGQLSDLGELPSGEFGLEAIALNDLPPTQPPIRDKELKILEGLKNLRSLGLFGADVGDEGAETIASIKSLRELELSQTRITDRGLESLAALPEIEKLFIRNVGDGVTDDGVKQFERRTGAQVFR